ncbi:hypothetical protein BTA35_0205025 [Oceanospirillum linum]|uniref:Uncharacterized protein n=1 Tax=Oceanospirillum linum TaxID=966 RepID=A0A1T1HG57_OCELI|nr:hypothetical protein BTA35_0205025 [Oceanospirillum linum]
MNDPIKPAWRVLVGSVLVGMPQTKKRGPLHGPFSKGEIKRIELKSQLQINLRSNLLQEK